MKSILVTIAIVAGIVIAPVPTTLRVLALVPILVAVLMVFIEELLIARARIEAAQVADTRLTIAYFAHLAMLPDPEWSLVFEPVERRRLRSIPMQRAAGSES